MIYYHIASKATYGTSDCIEFTFDISVLNFIKFELSKKYVRIKSDIIEISSLLVRGFEFELRFRI